MTTVTRYIQSGNDDAYTNGTVITLTGFIGVGNAGTPRNGGFIFRNLGIPRASTINGATITLTSAGTVNTTVCRWNFYGEASSTPSEFSTYADFNGRTIGVSTVAWNGQGGYTTNQPVTSPDIKSIIQEIVDRTDWNENCGAAVYLKDNGSDSLARRAFNGYEDGTALAAKIDIDYTLSTPPLTMRVSLPRYDCITDRNIDHYALYADQDNVLIKEFSRGTTNVTGPGTTSISHNLGYPPMFMGYVKITSANFQWIYGSGFFNNYYAYASTASLLLVNKDSSGTKIFKHYLFYDNQK